MYVLRFFVLRSSPGTCVLTSTCLLGSAAGISCHAVERHRLPRGRSGVQKRDAGSSRDIIQRVGRLESLIERMQSNTSSKRTLV